MAPKTISALDCNAEKATALRKITGAFLVASFIVIWVASCASPVLLAYAILKGFYIPAGIIIASTIAAYMPWKKGPISRFLSYIYSELHPFYYKSFSIEFEGDSLPSPDDPQTLYAIHPHGAFCIGWSALFCAPTMGHVRFCFAPSLHASPFFRLFSRCVGNPGSAARFSMIEYLKNGEHLALPPGGFEEATLSSTTQDRVFIKKRTGFIRLCLMHGCAVRPVYVFGEKDLFSNIQGMWKLRLSLNRYGVPTILVYGNALCPILPKSNVDMRVVVGAPLALPKIAKPSKEEVALWHGKYVAVLTKLFEEHKEAAYGPEKSKTVKLEVW